MNRRLVRSLAGAALLVAVPFLLSQSAGSSPPAQSQAGRSQMPSSLEDFLTTALRSNPDILLAEAKLRETQAELNQVRLKVTQEVASLFHQQKTMATVNDVTTMQLEEAKKLHERNLVSRSELSQAVLAQANAEANLAKMNAQLRYTLGVGSSQPAPARGLPPEKRTLKTRRLEIPPRFRAALQTEIDVVWENTPLRVILDSLQDLIDIPFVYSADVSNVVGEEYETTVRLGEQSVADLLLALMDIHQGEFCFVIRDYGVLMIDREVAERIDGATIPPNVPLIRE